MADRIGTRELRELVQDRNGTCVSIYQVSEPAAPQSHQNPTRFKNLLREAETRLRGTPLSGGERQRLLAPADELLENDWFWTHQSEGLAVFLADGFSRHFCLPTKFDDQVYVGDHFRIRPLLSLMQSLKQFYVLAASENDCKLWSGDRFGVNVIDVKDLPGDLHSALQWERGSRELNLHSMQPRPQSGAAAQAMFHGQVVEEHETELEAYFRQVDAALWEFLREQTTPLLFAGVGELFPIYQRVNSYPHFVQQPLTGSHDRITAKELHAEAWPLVQAATRNEEQRVLSEFSGRQSQGIATDQVPLIVQAASNGLVDTLVLSPGAQAWGTFDETTGHCDVLDSEAREGCDLLEFACRSTIQSGGRVLIADQIADRVIGFALLRVPVETLAHS